MFNDFGGLLVVAPAQTCVLYIKTLLRERPFNTDGRGSGKLGRLECFWELNRDV